MLPWPSPEIAGMTNGGYGVSEPTAYQPALRPEADANAGEWGQCRQQIQGICEFRGRWIAIKRRTRQLVA